MPLSVSDFRAASTALGGDSEVHLQTDKKKLATSWWQRFKVTFWDSRRSSTTIQERRQQTINTFLDAIQKEYGVEMRRDIVGPLLRTQLGGGARPLTARVVQDTLALIEARGGKNWMHNQRLISDLSHSCLPPKYNDVGCLSSVVSDAMDDVLPQARHKGVPEEFLGRLQKKYEPQGVGHFDMPGMSGTIRTKLSDSARGPGGGTDKSYILLDPETARGTATRAAKEVIVSEINQFQQEQYFSSHPSLRDAFVAKARERGFEGRLDLLKFKEVDQNFDVLVANSTTPLSQDEIGAMVNRALDGYFDRQQAKLANLDRIAMPAGPARENLTRLLLGSRMDVKPEVFDRAMTVVGQLTEAFTALRAATTPETRAQAMLDIGRLIDTHAKEAKLDAEGMDMFLGIVKNLYAAQFPGQMDGLRTLMTGEDMGKAREKLIEMQSSRDDARVAQAAAGARFMNAFSV